MGGQKKSKEQIAKAASASKKGGKKKWSKGKVKDKLNNKVFLDEGTWKNMQKDLPNMALVTVSSVCEKFKIIGSIARPVMRKMAEEGKLVKFGNQHSTLPLYAGAAYLEKKKAAN